jgi:hypothetical protein
MQRSQSPRQPRKPRTVEIPRPRSYDNRQYLSLAEAAEVVTERFFSITEKAIAAWPLPSVIIGPRRHVRKADVLAHAAELVEKAEAERIAQPKSNRGGWNRGRRAGGQLGE